MKNIYYLIGIIGFLSADLLGSSSQKIIVRSVNLRGFHVLESSELLSVIKTKPSSLFNKQYFDRRLQKFDAISLKTFYISKGFINAIVKDSVHIQDNYADVYFNLEEGKQIFLKNVNIFGNSTISENQILFFLKLRVGSYYNPIDLNKNLPILKSEYQKFGKLFTEIDVYESLNDSAEIIIDINEGKDVYIETYLIEGLKSIKSNIVVRELTFNQKDLYRKDEIDLSQRRLLESGIFSYAQISPSPILGSDSTVHLKIHVKQFKSREWQSIGGYYPIEYYEGAEPLPGAGAEFGWRNRSLNFTTTNFNIKLAGYIIPSQDYMYPKITFNTDIGNQWFLQRRLPTQIGFFYETFKAFGRFQDPYISRYGFKFVNQRNLNDRSYLHSELKWEKFFETEELEQRTYTLTTYIDRTDNLIMPSTGFRFFSIFHMSGGILGGSKSFYKLDFGFNHYSKIYKSTIFAGRYKIGKIYDWDMTNLQDTQYDLFYLGGSSSLRGWDMLRFKIASNGNPVGDLF